MDIKKIFSINVVYFDLGQGEDYVYHGKTDFHGIHKSDKLILSDKQKEILGHIEPYQIFPEYYVIKVNQFDDKAKSTLDEWIYYLKNNEIKDNFTAKGINEARELWRLDKLTDAERINYDNHLKNLRDEASKMFTLKVDAEDKVKKQRSIEIAKKLRDIGVSMEDIHRATGLTKDEIEIID